jgi:hypothetical protein
VRGIADLPSADEDTAEAAFPFSCFGV